MRAVLAAFALVATFLAAPRISAQPLAQLDAHAVIAKMGERNPNLSSYRARVHVDVRMLNFPFLSPKLDGTSYFKRPDNYLVVFDRVPGYAKGFERIFNDIGDPLAWEKDSNVSFEGIKQLYGHPMYVLRMTKKIHSTILDHTLAYVDPGNFQLLQMEWHYTSGGVITMRQWYRTEGAFNLLSTQHAEIDIPHVHAVADSNFSTYQTNVAIDESVFKK